jgi:serralysin
MSASFDGATLSFSVAGPSGTDTITGVEVFIDSTGAVRSSFQLMGTAPVSGTASANTITGGDGSDYLFGLGGNDSLSGRDGHDFLDGGTGRDRMMGGAGDDVYFVDDARDRVVEHANQGVDTIHTTLARFSLGNNLENLTYAGSASFRGTGNGLDNALRGGNGNDVLNGRGGSDTLWGGAGWDVFEFNSALGPSNIDVIKDFNTFEDSIRLENSVFLALSKTGPLPATSFVTGTAAVDLDDRIVFNNETGALSYDRDGSGSAASVKFAVLDLAGLIGPVTASDFVIV